MTARTRRPKPDAGPVRSSVGRLAGAARAGDVDAFGCLAERFAPSLGAFCTRLMGQAGAADLAQETLLRAFRSLPALAEPERFGAWLFGIAANLARQQWRRQARWPVSLESLRESFPDVPWADAVAPPDRLIEEDEQRRRLVDAIEALPAALKDPLVLHYLEGLSYDEVAGALDVPISAVRGRLFRSRTALRRALGVAGARRPRRPRPDERATVHKGAPVPMKTPDAPREDLIPVTIDSIRTNVTGEIEPTPEAILTRLRGWAVHRPGPTPEPGDLEAVAGRIAALLTEAGFRVGDKQNRVVLLKEQDGERVMPIIIGVPEADAIAAKLQHAEVPRPLTQDLLRSAFEALDAQVRRVVVNDLVDETFYARIYVDVAGREVDLDARPSDAIALAVRAGVPIFVAGGVFEKSSLAPEQSPERSSG